MTETEKSTSFLVPDSPWNPFRLGPPEGEMVAIKFGSKDGPLDRIISSVSGYHFRNEEPNFVPDPTNEWGGWDLIPNSSTPGYVPREKGMLEEEFRIITVGFFKAYHIPHLRYSKWEKKDGSTKTDMVGKDRKNSPFFYYRYTIGIPVAEVESVGNFKTTIKMNLVVHLTNPYKAVLLSGGWEGILDGAVHGAVREYLAPRTIEQIRKVKEGGALTKRILKINDGPDGIEAKFGVKIIDVRFMGFDMVSPDERTQKALEQQEINRLLAEAAVERGREISTLAKAEAEAAALVAKAYGSGEAAAAVKQAELLRDALTGTRASVVSIGGGTPLAVTIPPKK